MRLSEFFVELLQDDNLAAYYSQREEYIDRQGAGLAPDDRDLILKGSLRDIEQRIFEQETESESGHLMRGPLLIVTPIVTP